MNQQEEKTTEPVPVAQRWVHSGLWMLKGRKIAWLPEPAAGDPLGSKLWRQHDGSWVVGGICQASVSRHDRHVHLHGAPSRWLQRLDDHVSVARWMSSTGRPRRARTHGPERNAAREPALAKAMEPLLAIAATLVPDAQIRALMAYVQEQVYVARFRR
jgi:hypothetical protein